MESNYSYDQKKKLAAKIQGIKKKENLIEIFKIVHEDNPQFTENHNGVFMFFDKLENTTYYKIEKFLNKLKRKNDGPDQSSITSSECKSEKAEYTPYADEEFPAQTNMEPKLKYSNTERSLIKRKQYDKNINIDNDANIVYRKFGNSEKEHI